MTAERGLRAARLASFAPDGVMLDPAPVRVHAAPATDTAAPRTPEARVTRTPAQAGVSHDYGFGFTTGENISSGARAQENGVFLAVWQREPRTPWKLILDARLPTAQPVDFAALGAAPRPDAHRHASGPHERARLLALEADAFGAGAAAGLTPTRYAQLLRDDVRLYRDGAVLASRAAVATAIAHRMASVRWTPLDARISAAGDMALTYGQYREEARSSAPAQGYYAHLWLRDRAGSWRLAFDLVLTGAP
jgi:ketosteroid isomerase-like protein